MISHVEDAGDKSFVKELVLLSALEASETSTVLSRAQMPSVEGNVPFEVEHHCFKISRFKVLKYRQLSFNTLGLSTVDKKENYPT